jgi:two-component system, LytTR family, response regulator
VLRVLVADDEKLARDTITQLLAGQEDVSNIYEAENGKKALASALELKPDILFLDIEMPGMSGVEVAGLLPQGIVVIFVTAFNEYAVMAFELNAVDYLLKPFDDERFHEALNKARARVKRIGNRDYSEVGQLIQQMLDEQKKKYRDRLVIRDPGRIRLVDVQQISYISGAGNYAEIHLSEGKYVLHRETLSVLEEQLDPKIFVRIHRSTIVRRSIICELRPNEKGDYSVVLQSGEMLTLSRRNRAKLEELTNLT